MVDGEPVYELTGDIDPGAEKVFTRLVGTREGGWLVLRSLGGDSRASIMIGWKARRQKIKTYVAPNSLCLSGCAIIWAGGYERWVARGGTVAFHRPWQMVDGKPKDGDARPLIVYFKYLKFSDEVIEKFLWPADSFFYLTEQKAAELGVEARFND